MQPLPIVTLPETITVPVGIPMEIAVSVEPAVITAPVEWTVSPDGILTVEDGAVIAAAAGTATVTATANGVSAVCEVTAIAPAKLPAGTTTLEEVLKTAREAGARVVTATHHSLLTHTEFSKESFLMFGNESMAALASAYGVELNLSGHMHIQHIARKDGPADAALGAFCIWPHRYALVTLGDDGSLRYEAKALSDRFLPEGFPEESKEWFGGITRDKAKALLVGTDEEIAVIADYAVKFNLAYFSGTYRKEDACRIDDPAFALWEKQTDTAFFPYMKLVMNEAAGDNLHWEQ